MTVEITGFKRNDSVEFEKRWEKNVEMWKGNYRRLYVLRVTLLVPVVDLVLVSLVGGGPS